MWKAHQKKLYSILVIHPYHHVRNTHKGLGYYMIYYRKTSETYNLIFDQTNSLFENICVVNSLTDFQLKNLMRNKPDP